jgi:hypothetical protein
MNAIAIKEYLTRKFSGREVSNFPTLYPESKSQKLLRRAVIHKNTTVYYIFDEDKVTVVALKDNRQNKPS